MHSKVAQILKIIAIIIWVLGVIIGIVSGATGLFSSYYHNDAIWLNFLAILIVWVLSFVIGIIYYAFGELLEHVTRTSNYTADFYNDMKEQHEYLSIIVTHISSSIQSDREGTANTAGTKTSPLPCSIVCPECGRIQLDSREACIWCGHRL